MGAASKGADRKLAALLFRKKTKAQSEKKNPTLCRFPPGRIVAVFAVPAELLALL